MLSENGHLYLVDLGSAMLNHERKEGICEGTKGYAHRNSIRAGSVRQAISLLWENAPDSQRQKRSDVLSIPGEFFWFLFRCTRKQEKYRYQNMASVRKILEKLGKRYRTVTWRKRFLESFGVMFFVTILVLLAEIMKPAEFSAAVAEVTDLYYQAERYQTDSGFSASGQKFLQAAEKKLQKLSRIDQGKEEQRYIALLLAGMQSFWMSRNELLCIMKTCFFTMKDSGMDTENMECF